LNSGVARFTTHESTCLAAGQVIAGCEKLVQKVVSNQVLLFAFYKVLTWCAFYWPKANLFCCKWRDSLRVWRNFYPEVSIQATWNKLISCKTSLNMGGKTAEQHSFSTRFAVMLQNKLHVFVTVAL